ncbi:MAG TPA: outer membrane beta-barrel protein [Chitinophagaceae bacterium]|nr:outer membrane beta-barrel protein [Chitinophagaceae bacterium]
MKTRFIFLCFIIVSLQAVAQKRSNAEKESFIRMGFKGGLNLNKIDGRSFKNEFTYNYSLGAFLQINPGKKFGIQPEVNFTQSSAEQSNDITVIYDDVFLGGNQVKAKLNYLKLAGLLNFDVGPSQRIKLQLGPQWGILVNQAVDSLKRPEDVFKKGEFSILGGLFIQMPFIHIGSRYEIGLTNINAIDNKDQWKSQTWQFFVGFTF